MADVVLTAALRSNLQALQLTQALIDSTQLRLSTGKKVNSALDNPRNFFAAQTLSNRSTDLSALLDGVGQSIQTVKAADKGVESVTTLVEQAESIANTAREKAASGAVAAGVTGNVSIKGIADLTAETAGAPAASTFTFTVVDDNNDVIQVNDVGGTAANTYTVTLRAAGTTLAEAEATSTSDLLNAINAITRDSDNSQIFNASLDTNGQLKIVANDGYSFRMVFDSNTAGVAADKALASSVGLGKYTTFAEANGAETLANASRVALTASNKIQLSSLEFTDNATSTIATRNALLSGLRDDTNTARFAGADAGDNLNVDVLLKNGTRKQISDVTGSTGLASATVGAVIDAINANTTTNEYVEFGFDEETGQFTIDALSSDVIGVAFSATDSNSNNAAAANFGFGAFANTGTTQFDLTVTANAALYTESENVFFAQGAAELASLKTQYGNLLDQIDELVDDSGYAGVNLLAGETLKTYFNEDRTSLLETVGVSLKYGELGLSKDVDFGSVASADAIIDDVKAALTTVRNFGSLLANDLSVIQTREGFTKGLIDTLREGADKLTLADQNEEGAKLLSLQTRQQLGVTALSLASQSQQAILRLF